MSSSTSAPTSAPADDAPKWDKITRKFALGSPILWIIVTLVGVIGTTTNHGPASEWLKLAMIVIFTVLVPLLAIWVSLFFSESMLTKEVRLKLAEAGATSLIGVAFLLFSIYIEKLSHTPVDGTTQQSSLVTLGTGLILSIAVLKYVAAALEVLLSDSSNDFEIKSALNSE